MRKQVLRARAICRHEKTKQQQKNKLIVLFLKMSEKSLKSCTFYLQQTKLIFSEVPIIGFKNPKSLKDHLVRAVLSQLDREGRPKPCEGANRSCEVSDSVKDTTKFYKAEPEETFKIFKGPLDCKNLKNVIYLSESKKCQFKFPCVGSTVRKFRFRYNNYKSILRKFRKKFKKGIIQEIK